ncbi:HEAT repeat domain-containing protein [Rubrobacter calidifluminis]|uniref:HEAT repeat domain-containing protein n=1 Tax=Rubrobacter calidifluminis TaxID=1392640 RepID=UPI0023615A61|nr:HEAT repeat domain-containing protein [Rubrobacter calidifluminis]
MESVRFVWPAVLVIAGLNVLMLFMTVALRLVRSVRERRLQALLKEAESLLEGFLASDANRDGLRVFADRHPGVLASAMVGYLSMMRGAGREGLENLAAELGLVDRYLAELSSRNRWRRARAAENLGYLGGPEVVGPLSGLLSDGDETVRAVAARALARIGTQEAARSLVHSLGDPSDLTRLRVAENLERLGPLAVAPLIERLRSGEERASAMAARILGNLRAREATPALLQAARDGEGVDLRAQAVLALGRIGDPEYVPLLLAAARDQEWPVRAQAANALRMIGDVSAIPQLERMVSDREWWVRVNAARALAGLGPAGERALVRVLEGRDRFARDRAAAALESRGVTERIVQDLTRSDERGREARRVIQAMITAGATRRLHRLIDDLPGDGRRELESMLRRDGA